ncbi:MAG: mechanosensitive ion channel family protein [Rubrobacteraceae bacterium]
MGFTATLAQQALSVSAIELSEFYAPVAFIVGAVLIGLVFEMIVLKKLKDWISNSRLRGKEVIINSARGVTTLWFGIAGAHFAVVRIPMDQSLDDSLNSILLAALILSGAIVLARLVAGLIGAYAGRAEGLPSSSLLTNLARIAILAMGVLIILQSLGVKIAPLLAALGVGGLAVALALQETLSNLFSGVLIIASRQLRPGDFVGLDSGEEGYVVDVTWRNTTIRTLGNNMVIVPNHKIAQSNITNYYQPERQMSVTVPVGVSYSSDLQHVEDVTIAVANEVMTEIEGGVPEFEPFIRFNNFGDFSIDFSVIMRTREVAQQYNIMHELMKLLHKRYRGEGIEIPYPVTTNIHTNGHTETSGEQRWSREP